MELLAQGFQSGRQKLWQWLRTSTDVERFPNPDAAGTDASDGCEYRSEHQVLNIPRGFTPGVVLNGASRADRFGGVNAPN